MSMAEADICAPTDDKRFAIVYDNNDCNNSKKDCNNNDNYVIFSK